MYPAIFKNLKHIVTQLCSHFNLIKASTTGRPLKIKTEDALTLALYQHRSTRATKKSVFDDFKETLRCSYKTLVVSMNRVAILALRVLFILMRLGRKHAHLVKYTDATDIPVCLNKNALSHKTLRGFASWGHSGKGFYFGLKMTLTRDAEGRMLGIRFSQAGANDRTIFEKINAEIDGIIVGDAGYISKELEKKMYREGKRWILIKPTKSMKKLQSAWQYHLYNSRFQIEFDFRNIKLFHGLVTSLPRSVDGYLANYIYSLLSFVLR
jgi:hypothetical protein